VIFPAISETTGFGEKNTWNLEVNREISKLPGFNSRIAEMNCEIVWQATLSHAPHTLENNFDTHRAPSHSASKLHHRYTHTLPVPITTPDWGRSDTTLNTAYTVGSSILWVCTFVYHIFIHFNNFSSKLTNFIDFSFIVHPIYLHYIMSRK
jgi:hypothetical protein